MMKRIFFVFLAIILFLNACAPKGEADTAAPTARLARMPRPTGTLIPTLTPMPTHAIVNTTIPIIPTFTPTFDIRTIVTATPAPKAECPEEDPLLIPEFPIPSGFCDSTHPCMFGGAESEILDFLNRGGSIEAVTKRLSKAPGKIYGKGFVYEDLTGDSVPELAFEDFNYAQRVHVFYCDDGKYELYPPKKPPENLYGTDYIYSVEDMNLDGIPELVIADGGGCSGSGCFAVGVVGWNGDGFTDLSPDASMTGPRDFQIRDVDGNGTKELILTGDAPGPGDYIFEIPWRLKTSIYSWNGQAFAVVAETFAPPQYRFQAIQDADRYVTLGDYDKALTLYQDAIFSNKLDWWSNERRDYEINNSYYFKPATPYPTPAPDTTEYPRLAAYAYYRIMLLYIARGYESDARTIYKTLQQKFPVDNPGYPYAEMGIAFWNAYESTHKMYDGCAAAIEYVAEHPEVLKPLSGGSDQDHHYVPADVCPFR
ncbi:MAG: hypothetical protein HY258_06600 [Chloroflexi bacterium]|nr:hypothetical protein [Chloroflexota bacterium]